MALSLNEVKRKRAKKIPKNGAGKAASTGSTTKSKKGKRKTMRPWNGEEATQMAFEATTPEPVTMEADDEMDESMPPNSKSNFSTSDEHFRFKFEPLNMLVEKLVEAKDKIAAQPTVKLAAAISQNTLTDIIEKNPKIKAKLEQMDVSGKLKLAEMIYKNFEAGFRKK